jgi:hypothetical protein
MIPPSPTNQPVEELMKHIPFMVLDVFVVWLDQVLPAFVVARTVPFAPATQPVLEFTNDIDLSEFDVLLVWGSQAMDCTFRTIFVLPGCIRTLLQSYPYSLGRLFKPG